MIGLLPRHCQLTRSGYHTVFKSAANALFATSRAALAAALLGFVVAPPATAQEPGPADLPVAAGDRLVFVREGDLWTAEPDGSGARPLASTPEREVRPVPCPDGSTVAYEAYDADQQDYSIYTIGVTGGTPRRLMERARNPAWSPDGGRIAFSMRRRGSLDIWLMNRDGDDLQRVLDTPENEYLPVWSPSSGTLAFIRETREANRTRYEIVARAADGSETVVHSRLGQSISSLCWAPSADLLFASRTEDDPLDRLYRITPGAAEAVTITDGFDGGLAGLWTGVGDGILYLERRNDQSRPAFFDDGRSEPLNGLRDSDAELALLPGQTRRAAQITVLGRRSYYLPTPEVAGEDVLVPLPDVAKQLSLTVESEGDTVTVSSPTISIAINPATGQANLSTPAGPDTRPLQPKPKAVDGVLLVPLKTLATWYGLRAEWKPAERTLRISSPVSATPETPADTPAEQPADTPPPADPPPPAERPENPHQPIP